MRFHLVDRILECEPGVSVRGRKVCSLAEDFWEGEAGAERMPPPLVLEAFCQAGTWLVMITTERRKRAALLSIESVDFLGDVRPGDVLDLEGTVESMGDEVAVLSGRAVACRQGIPRGDVGLGADGRVVLEVRDVMCALIDADTLADLDDTERLQTMLTRDGA